jgi:hypothetical protein
MNVDNDNHQSFDCHAQLFLIIFSKLIFQSDDLSDPCSKLSETNNNTLDNNESKEETRGSTKKNMNDNNKSDRSKRDRIQHQCTNKQINT